MLTEPITGLEQLRVGDKVRHKTWLSDKGTFAEVLWIRSDSFRINIIQRNRLTFGINIFFSKSDWLRVVEEMPYDPTQQGDCEDDI